MKKYELVKQQLMAVEQAAWWHPQVRRMLKAAPLVVLFLLLNTRSARASCSFNPTPDPTADGSANSLRAAIEGANASGQDCLIELQAGTYTLTIKNTNGQENNAAEGDLDITDSGHTVTIQGQGPQVSIVAMPPLSTHPQAHRSYERSRGAGIHRYQRVHGINSGTGNSDTANSTGDNGIDDRVFQVLGGANAVFRKLTIKGGMATDDGTAGAQPGTTEAEGGGILVQDGGHVTLSQVWVDGNQAIGGMGARGTTRSVNGINGAPGWAGAGGGLFVSAGSINLTNSKIFKNEAKGGTGGFGTNTAGLGGFLGAGGAGGTGSGGGLYVRSGVERLIGSTISGNIAIGGSGGFGVVFGDSGGADGNSGAGGAGMGGGLYILSGSAELLQSTVSGNHAIGGLGMGPPPSTGLKTLVAGGDGGTAQGAGLFSGAGELNLRATTISGNSATGGNGGSGDLFPGSGGSSQGTGIFIAAGSISLANSTLYANVAKGGSGGVLGFPTPASGGKPAPGGNTAGGGLYIGAGNISLAGVTLASNRALATSIEKGLIPGSSSGGGIANIGATSFITNTTLIANNTQDSGNADNGNDVSGSITASFSLIGQSAGATITNNGGNLLDVDPLLDSRGLRSNGGPTQTVALQAGSPAIDVVPVADCTDQASPPNPLVTDQRFFPRPDNAETQCDIGAYEYQDAAFIRFSNFGIGLTIDPNANAYYVNSPFTLGAGGSIDPATEPVSFGIGSYAVRLPVGSFVQQGTGYVYQRQVNGIFLRMIIEPTSTAGQYNLHVEGSGVTPATAGPVAVTLTIGNNSGTSLMTGKFD